MGQKRHVLDKLARNLAVQGETVSRGTGSNVVVEDGAADITISYVQVSTTPSMLGGIDDSVSPFLGIGQGNPGKISMKVAGSTDLATAMTSVKAVKVLASIASMANDIQILDGSGAVVAEIRGHSDLIGMGQ